MSVEFQDYYKTLGVAKGAKAEDIQKAYRKLARKLHPDVNKAKDAEEKFKAINEAYEVLKDPEKRKQYDALGSNWKAGQGFRPNAGWPGGGFPQGARGGGQRMEMNFDFGEGGGGFSDFFNMLFGQARTGGGGPGGPGGGPGAGPRARRGPGFQPRQARGADQEAELELPIEEAFRGGKKTITLTSSGTDETGMPQQSAHTYEVKIPPGVTDGARIRLSGQGGKGAAGGTAGDLFLRIKLKPHPRFRLEGSDIVVDVPIAPWEAVLGGKVKVPTPEGAVMLTVPPGTQSQEKFRLRGKGMTRPTGDRGDLYVHTVVQVPKIPTPEEKELFEKLKEVSRFDPRGE